MAPNGSDTYTNWALVFLTPWSRAWLGCAALVLFLGAACVIYSYRQVGGARWLIALRLSMVVCVLALVTQPAIQWRVVRRIEDRVAIIVDRSRSMTLQAAPGQSRWERLTGLLGAAQPALDALAQTHQLDWFDLAGPVAATGLAALQPYGETTDLVGALEKATQAGAGKPLAGIVLLSDGGDNVTLNACAASGLSDSVQHRLQNLRVPVNTLDVATDVSHPYSDLAITDVQADAFAFIHNTFTIEVSLLAIGLTQGETRLNIPITLKKEGEVLATQQVALQNAILGHATFKLKPDAIGDFVYTVSVPAQPGEATVANNNQHFVVQVIRDKIRVLQVSGRPSWDERFLRQYLKDNANTDLVSFFILRTPTDDVSIPEEELSLIPFPVNKLFTTELQNFDVIIFQNFDFRPYRMAHFLPNIREAVLGGLGFVMLGGDASFYDGGFLGTAVDDILPVRLGQTSLTYSTVTPQLTPAGLHHPITDLAANGQRRDSLFATLPPWTASNAVAQLTPGATALVADPQIRGTDGHPAPLIAAMDAGKGRTMTIATDALWRWQFAPGPSGAVSTRIYQRFWSNALRWLVRDPEHAHIRVLPDQRHYTVGQDAQLSLTVFNQDYQPVPGTHVQVRLQGLQPLQAKQRNYVTGDGGMAQIRYTDLEAGAYRLTAQADVEGVGQSMGTAVFVVAATTAELRDGAPHPETLQAIARTTGGAILSPQAKRWEHLKLVDPDVVQVDRRRNVELWDNGWVMAFLTLLFATDWFLRRRRGFF